MKFLKTILFLFALFATVCNASNQKASESEAQKAGKWVVFIGCAGCGKGTQAELLSSENGFIVIGMGDLLRKNKDMVATPDGKTLGDIMKTGVLVPNSITVDLVTKRLEEIEDVANKNVLFEGWPRVLEQAKNFDLILKKLGRKIDVVFNFAIGDENIAIKRILGRYSCKKCGKIYNEFFLNPTKEGVCDVCKGTEFNKRSDDNRESVKNRLSIFNKETRPIIKYYKKAGVLCNVKADANIGEVRSSILKCLDLKEENK
ncbi:MAG: nucleoside monophosphate kinase [Holosporales bacterium]|jgi:adenylate kinase|nr:nucleoside monophosphate kinase [Holosporales bacterium]